MDDFSLRSEIDIFNIVLFYMLPRFGHLAGCGQCFLERCKAVALNVHDSVSGVELKRVVYWLDSIRPRFGIDLSYTIKLNTGGNLLTILPDGTETIDGRASLTLQKEGMAVRMVSDDANWQIVGEVGYAGFHRDDSDQDNGADPGNSYDQVVGEDLIVAGSECIGYDCLTSEAFGSDTLVLKENNLRIYFQDSSNSGSFPTVDWRISVNDSTDGGRNYFAIDDAETGTPGLLIEAGGNVRRSFLMGSDCSMGGTGRNCRWPKVRRSLLRWCFRTTNRFAQQEPTGGTKHPVFSMIHQTGANRFVSMQANFSFIGV